ncbi:MAG: inorganic phosphate transporter [Candidatus Poribacteria bacterium]|nr:inorganic phosphate transporter [Candidatus Poribacteria bacterium]
MGIETIIILILASGFGFYMAWNIGANDVANAMGTSVGSGALTLKQAIIVAVVFEFAGAFLVGAHVTETVRKGMIDLNVFKDMEGGIDILIYGMLASLLAAGVWLQIASYFGWPVSTTHAIVGAVVGFGIVAGGAAGVAWGKIGQIVMSWIASPLLSGTIAFVVFSAIRRAIINVPNPVQATKRWAPGFIFLVFAILTLVTLFKGLKNLGLDLSFSQALMYASGIGLVASIIGRFLIRRVHVPSVDKKAEIPLAALSTDLRSIARRARRMHEIASKEARGYVENIQEHIDQLKGMVEQSEAEIHTRADFRFVEKVFAYLQILSACFVAFAHGANDVANSIGPLAAVVSLARGGAAALTDKTAVPLWILGLGGAGIVVGLSMWGWRVMETIGKKITELTPTRGFSAEFSTATTVVIASRFGLPISTTHTLVGAVLGVGLARGIDSLNLRIIRDIATSWVVTLPAGASMSILFFFILKAIFSTFGGPVG